MKAKRWFLRIGVILVLGVVFLLVLDGFMRSRTRPAPLLPNPNGYDDLVRAGKMATRLDNYREAPIEELRGFLKQNSDALEVARIGLSRECRIPTLYTKDHMPIENMMAIRTLADGLEIEAILAEKEDRPDEAITSCRDLFHLGFQVVEGGLWIDFLVGSVAQEFAIKHLKPMMKKQNASDSKKLIADLEKWSFDEKLFREIEAAEMDFQARNSGFLERLWDTVESMFTGSPWAPVVRARADGIRIRTSLLLSSLALHAYKLEHGALPPSLSELVPGYLKVLPLDPHSGKPLIYRTAPEGYKLYSVGPNGKDDQGLGDDVTPETTG